MLVPGSFTYTPNANENGADTFTFKVNDGTGGFKYGHGDRNRQFGELKQKVRFL